MREAAPGEAPPPSELEPPVANFSAVVTGLSVAFTDESEEGSGTVDTWLWDFGDGQTSTEQNPTHVYVLIGAYDVTLTVTADDDETDDFEDQVTAVVGRDGPGNWYVPEAAAQFTALGLAPPDFLWLCQEASGDLASTIGSLALVKNGAVDPLYQQSITDWSRKFVGTDGSTSGQSFRTSDAALDLASGQSAAMVALGSFTVAGAARAFMAISGANDLLNMAATTGNLRTIHNGNATDGTVAQGGITTVHQFCWYRNGTTNESGAVSDTDAVVGTHSEAARTGTVKALGTPAASSPLAARYGWFAIWLGANAERDWVAYLTTLRGA